jgi:arsenite-transporting ATPase
MSRIITFLGKGCTGYTTLAIATAKLFAQQGKRVLLATHTPNLRASILLETPLAPHPQVIAPNLQGVQLQTTAMLVQVWEELKQLTAQYLPTFFSESVYPGELIILPGFDSALTFNALRQYYTSGDYDVIIYDGREDLETLRLLNIPDGLDWYFRRFRQVFEALDLAKAAANIFGGPLASAIISANVDSQKLGQGLDQVRDWIEQGRAVVSDAEKLTAYLVTTAEPAAIAQARWLWGSAQQVNLTISGVLLYQSQGNGELTQLQQAFSPLVVNPIPALLNQNWAPLLQALPDFNASLRVPQPLTVNLAQRQVIVFLPGFNKEQVKVTQYGSQITIEAGDQRRNISLPPELRGEFIKTGKFEEPYLIISF